MTADQRADDVGYDRAVLVDVLVYHWRTNTSGCGCGWAELGRSWPEHVATVYEESVRARATDDLAEALGAEVGGRIDATTWTCSCGASATEASEHAAALGLYFHRRAGHGDVTVEVDTCPDPADCDDVSHTDECMDCGAWIHRGEPWSAHRVAHEHHER